MIISGYQGVGKSTLAHDGNGYIDLESGNFWRNGQRDTYWFIPYCNIAASLSHQGYTVFISSHKVVREWLSETCSERKAIVFPSVKLETEWLKRLENRYESTKLEKDFKAFMNARCEYSDNINDLKNQHGFEKIIIERIPYNLAELIDSHRWCS